MTLPWTPGEAQQASETAALAQQRAEDNLVGATRRAAEAEKEYRVALAQEIVRQHDVDKVAWTVAPDLARGDVRVAELRYARDVSEGVREAAGQAAWRLAADRRDVSALIGWSMRRELAENGAPIPDGKFDTAVFGRRAA